MFESVGNLLGELDGVDGAVADEVAGPVVGAHDQVGRGSCLVCGDEVVLEVFVRDGFDFHGDAVGLTESFRVGDQHIGAVGVSPDDHGTVGGLLGGRAVVASAATRGGKQCQDCYA